MRKKIKKMDCIEYLSVQAPLEKVDMLENKQSIYIHDFAKRTEFNIVGKMRRHGFSQNDVDRQWMQIVNMVRKSKLEVWLLLIWQQFQAAWQMRTLRWD